MSPAVQLVTNLVQAVLTGGDIPPQEIAVITPYQGQVRELARLLRGTGVRVDSVDAFQVQTTDCLPSVVFTIFT
jgi:superfamily I DNA and/or RNA helicase